MGHNKEDAAKACIHCNSCRTHCTFLDKYEVDIGTVNRFSDLAYHCFLCGTCTKVCPKGIDGRAVILEMRREQVRAAGGKLREKGYRMLLKEKQDYAFKNYRHVAAGSVLFPGCNFPSFYPETTKMLIHTLQEAAGINVVFDCCAKPVAELGLEEQALASVRRMEEKLCKAKVEELIMVCPNCYYFLKNRIGIKVTSIYEKLHELQIGKQIAGDCSLFLPCPDREERRWLAQLTPFVNGTCTPIEGTQCCGLGGCAGKKEPELARDMAQKLLAKGYEQIYTYCASCSGNLRRNGHEQAPHILTGILGSSEQADIDKSIVNRMKMKYW